MARSMTSVEKQRFRGYFPSLNVNQAVVTGEVTNVYNCISWTLGITNRWVWPGATIQAFDRLYNGVGFIRSNNGPIAAWGHSLSQMTHGSVSGPGHGPRWESKCGSDLRIQHGLNELVGQSYGRVLAFYARRHIAEATARRLSEGIRWMPKKRTYLSKAEAAALKKEVLRVEPSMRREFQRRYTAWRKTWSEPHLAITSDPTSLRYSKEFADVTALGAEALPLVVEKLSRPAEFFALQLYDVLQTDPSLRVDVDPGNEQIYEGEQGRAGRVVKHWLAR
jgi:hypothetical protein